LIELLTLQLRFHIIIDST